MLDKAEYDAIDELCNDLNLNEDDLHDDDGE